MPGLQRHVVVHLHLAPPAVRDVRVLLAVFAVFAELQTEPICANSANIASRRSVSIGGVGGRRSESASRNPLPLGAACPELAHRSALPSGGQSPIRTTRRTRG